MSITQPKQYMEQFFNLATKALTKAYVPTINVF